MSVVRVIDLALAIVGVEILALAFFRRRLGLRLGDVLGQILAGAILLAAVRCAVAGVEARWILLLLAASFPAHLYDLVRRARRAA
jgi:hypothetical protein